MGKSENESKDIAINLNSPVIVIGMHRSGTTMICDLLNSLGVNMGRQKEDNSEDVSWLKLNETLLCDLNASWYDLTHYKVNYPVQSNRIINKIQHLKKTLNVLKLSELRWGFKDPRTSLFLNEYSVVFPSALIINVVRHPLDVALSLSAREKRFDSGTKIGWFYYKLRAKLIYGVAIDRSPALLDIDRGIDLWFDYMNSISDFKGDIYTVVYEDFVRDPKKGIRDIADVLGLKCTEDVMDRLCEEIDGSAGYRFRSSEFLASKEQAIQKRLRQKNYKYCEKYV